MRTIVESPLRAILVIASVAVAFHVVCAPLWSCRYPPMTDLPFHAAHSSILRHYLDPSWRFHEQFTLQPIAVPYVLHYALGALFMLALPPVAAVKAATAVMLMMVPAGMAVLLLGMKRSPMGALLSLPFAYCALSHWGFISHVAGLGLFAASVGFAMLVVDRPTTSRSVGLAVSLVLLFFSHIFRYPMGAAAVIGAGVYLYPATRRFRPLVLPMAPSLMLFATWLVVRPPTLDTGAITFHLEPERAAEMRELVFGGFTDRAESDTLRVFARVAALVAVASLLALLAERRWAERTAREERFAIGAWLVVLSCVAVFLGLYFTLPMQIGLWWYVYPREATSAALLSIALLPGLPRSAAVRAPLVVAVAAAALGYGRFVQRKYAEFDAQTADFAEITRDLPRGPRLLYLIHDHGGSTRTVTPFVHLPAWVQAEHGGFLSFNFADFGAAPIAFRSREDPAAVVPPPVPLRWEWNSVPFEVLKHGAFFDWFLVRAGGAPDRWFEADPEIERVKHVGKWWLYRRFGEERGGGGRDSGGGREGGGREGGGREGGAADPAR